MAVPRVDPHSCLQNGLSCAHSTDSGQIQGILVYLRALLEAQCITEATLAFTCVLVSPPGSHDSLSLCVQPAPNCEEWPNVNMLAHVEHLQWSTT